MTQLEELVLAEAKALKKSATKKERSKLNFSDFDSQSTYSCIYGQMTGYCHSDRAVELIKTCAKRVYEPGDGFPHEGAKLNGAPSELIRKTNGAIKFWSPIEVYVSRNNYEGNKNLISFLKGETKTLF